MIIHRMEVKGELGFQYKFGKLNIILGGNKTGKSTFMKLLLYSLGTYIDDFITEISKKFLCEYVETDIEFKTGNKFRIIRKLPYADTVLMIPIRDDDTIDNENMEVKNIEELSDFILYQEGYNSQVITYGNNNKATMRFYFLLRAIFADQETTASKILAEIGGKKSEYLNTVTVIKKSIIETLLAKDNNHIQQLRMELQDLINQRKSIKSNIEFINNLINQDLNDNPILSKDMNKINSRLENIDVEKKKLSESKLENLAKLENIRNDKLENELYVEKKNLLELNDKIRILMLELNDTNNVIDSLKKELEQFKKMVTARQLLTQIPVEQCPICMSPISIKPLSDDKCPYCENIIKQNDYDNISQFKKMLDETLIEANITKRQEEIEIQVLENEKVNLHNKLTEMRNEHIKSLNELRNPIEEIINTIKIKLNDLLEEEFSIKNFYKSLNNKDTLNAQKVNLDTKIGIIKNNLEEAEKNSIKDVKNIRAWQDLFDSTLKYIYGDINETYIDPDTYIPSVDELELRTNSSASLKVAARLSYILSLFQLKDVKDININHIGILLFDSPKDKDLEMPRYKRFLEKVNDIISGQVFLTASILEKDIYEEIFGKSNIISELNEEKKLLQKIK